MENDNQPLRRELEHLPTEQIENMLQQELEKGVPNDDIVLQLLHLLETRKPQKSLHMGEKEKTAWQTFQKRIKSRIKKFVNVRRWIAVAASLVLVFSVIFALLPQKANAETFFEMLARWTADFFQLFNSEADNNRSMEYVFETDNPGLKQVYDAVVEIGVTVPVVPMWLPEGSELVELTVVETPMQKRVYARFAVGERDITINVGIVDTVKASDYYRENQEPHEYEKTGITHHIMRNKDVWTVVWTQDKIECSLAIDCQEDTLYQILDSIYVMEENE